MNSVTENWRKKCSHDYRECNDLLSYDRHHSSSITTPMCSQDLALEGARQQTSYILQGCPKLPDRSQPLVGRSSPYYEDMWRTYCFLTSFFPIVGTCLSCEDIARQSCAMVPRWRFLATFLRPVFSASCAQQVPDLHFKFALRPHHVCK